MNARITSDMLVGALRRSAEAAGGGAMVLSHGDAISGAVIIVWAPRGETQAMFERGLGPDDRYIWRATGPEAGSGASDYAEYLEKRRRFDPDIWVVEIEGIDDPDWLQQMVGID